MRMSLGIGPLRVYFGHSRRRGPTFADRNKARVIRRHKAEVAARIANLPRFTDEERQARGSLTPKADAAAKAGRVHHSAYSSK